MTDEEKLEKIISQTLESLTIDKYPGRENMYYLTGLQNNNEKVMDSILIGAHSKVNSVRFFDKNGEPINLKSDKNVLFNNPIYLDPYHFSLCQSLPKIKKVEIDITTFKPTKRKTIVLNSNTYTTDYDFKITDSIVLFNFKKSINIDYRSFRFFDRNGKELEAKWVSNYMDKDFATNGEEFTQKFIEQVLGKNAILYTMEFIIKNVSKVSFDILTNDLKFRHIKTSCASV